MATKNNNKDSFEKLSFREAMEKLNETVSLLEGNTLELEESLEQYKTGVELLSICKKRLDSAQIQVEELMGKIESEEMSDEQRDTTLS